ncbi:ligase-associated DNA damage response endonuclease PdeM [Mucilaginibacter terrae]|uniref:DNA ligase-associated metallophosphoesterase n=1 Tax=Mucilaginibacter terrae TaxID=1955052 RepID=A0ABU3GUZ8_9SPHI|nr:ligase-associated DNA damage response endonuclease PdeM [Mucilaginibacter terrae]MDT3403296.1 DNA ligase-associated metallophosphoesterase [Mucilaginibacter terrae]
MTGHNFNLLGQDLLLLPERAIYWQQQKALIVADVHLGKAGHFRKAGIAVPRQVGLDDLDCLTRLIHQHKPEKIMFLGDLFHSEMNTDWHDFARWRREHFYIKMQLIIGNHDIIKERHYHELDVSTHDEIQEGPFLMQHHPQDETCLVDNEHYVFCGHIHPGVRLSGRGGQAVTLPCFAFGDKQAILPSFGKFTGKVALRHRNGDHVFGVLKEKVIPV